MPNLQYLVFYFQSLISLDVSNNILLESVISNSNDHLDPPDLSEAQLAAILNLFASRDGSDKWNSSNGRIYMTGNPGGGGAIYNTAKAAAVDAGWEVTD